jgi:hypothetical protein
MRAGVSSFWSLFRSFCSRFLRILFRVLDFLLVVVLVVGPWRCASFVA